MIYDGTFINEVDQRIRVRISNGGGETVEIGGEDSGIFFLRTDPVTTETSFNNLLDVCLRQSCTIRLATDRFRSDFFSADPLTVTVHVWRDDRLVFAGYLSPQTYSQPYNSDYDTIELNCIDALSALEGMLWRGVKRPDVVWSELTSNAKNLTFRAIIGMILGWTFTPLEIGEDLTTDIIYHSKREIYQGISAFSRIAVNEKLFLSTDEDSTWDCLTVLEAVLKYLNLHARADGLTLHIFDWDFVMQDGEPVELTAQNVYGTNTQISVGECYNQIKLTCNVTASDIVIESPLDDDALTSPFPGRQLYMREYIAENDNGDGMRALAGVLCNQHWGSDNGKVVDTYIRVLNNKKWEFYDRYQGTIPEPFLYHLTESGIWQNRVPDDITYNRGCALVGISQSVTEYRRDDNDRTSALSTDNYLVIGVGGKGEGTRTAEEMGDWLNGGCPRARYTSGAVNLSPEDNSTTRYLVISGQVLMNSTDVRIRGVDGASAIDWQVYRQFIEGKNGVEETYAALRTFAAPWLYLGFGSAQYFGKDRKVRYSLPRYFKSEKSTGTPMDNDAILRGKLWEPADEFGTLTGENFGTYNGLTPPDTENFKKYCYSYSAPADSTDRLASVHVVACMLKVGDKCLVQTADAGDVGDFEWRIYKSKEECSSEEEWLRQCFYISFNPKMGDYIVGQEYYIRNNVTADLNIEASGTVIPIRKEDQVAGPMEFTILGPVNLEWKEYLRRHRTLFRPETWSETSKVVLNDVLDIWLKDFKVEIVSDNGKRNPLGSEDLVYVSDTSESYVNPLDDLTFDIHSALTPEERTELGMLDLVGACSTAIDTTDNGGVVGIRWDGKILKPEQIYVDSAYRMLSPVRIQIDTALKDAGGDGWHLLRHPALPGRVFFPVAVGHNYGKGSVMYKGVEK